MAVAADKKYEKLYFAKPFISYQLQQTCSVGVQVLVRLGEKKGPLGIELDIKIL